MNVLWVMLGPGSVQPFIFDTLSSISATVMVISLFRDVVVIYSQIHQPLGIVVMRCFHLPYALSVFLCLQSWWGCSHTGPLPLRVEKDIYNFLPPPTLFIIHCRWIHIFDLAHILPNQIRKNMCQIKCQQPSQNFASPPGLEHGIFHLWLMCQPLHNRANQGKKMTFKRYKEMIKK